MPTKESGLVANICKAIHAKYPTAWVFKTVGNPYQMSGVPDLLLGVNGLLIGLEVKFQRPGESRQAALSRVTPVQRNQIHAMRRAGCYADAVLSVDEALDSIEAALSDRTDIHHITEEK